MLQPDLALSYLRSSSCEEFDCKVVYTSSKVGFLNMQLLLLTSLNAEPQHLPPLFARISVYFKTLLLLKARFPNAVSSQMSADSDTRVFFRLIFREVFPWNGTLSFG